MDADRVLVNHCLGGDLGAFEELVNRHRDVVVRVAARIVGPADAEDVTQDAFLRAFHRLQRFRGDASFRAWLLQITHNAAVDHLNRRRGEPVPTAARRTRRSGSSTGCRPSASSSASARAAWRSSCARFAEQRAVLVLRDVEGFSYGEIARITSAPLGT